MISLSSAMWKHLRAAWMRAERVLLSLLVTAVVMVTSWDVPQAYASVMASAVSASVGAAAGPALSVADSGIAETLERVAGVLRRVQPKGADKPDAAAVLGRVGDDHPMAITRTVVEAMDALGDYESVVRQSWEQDLATMASEGLPGAVIAQHRANLQEFLTRSARFQALLGPLRSARSSGSEAQAAQSLIDLAGFFAEYDSARGFTALGDRDLAIQLVSAQATPDLALNQAEAQAKASGKAAEDPPGPAELAETVDVQLTPEIRALAAQLGNQPVAIRNWVHDHIEFYPTYGSIQGSALTLLNRRGNAHDIASLTIALLRAAGIPARYAKGVVEVPIDQARNWLGDVATPQMVVDLMQKGGVPSALVTTGGTATAIRFEHVWVEAWVDLVPSRGAKHRTGDQWAAIDVAYKQYDYTAGSDWRETYYAPRRQELMDLFVADVAVDAAGGISGLNFEAVNERLEEMALDLTDQILAQNPQATAEVLFPSRTIRPGTAQVLAGTLPYALRGAVARFAEIPAAQRHQAILSFYTDETSLRFDSPAASVTLPLPRIGSLRLLAEYVPVGAADAAAIQQAVDSNAGSLAVGAINVIPRLMLGAEELFRAGGVRMGTQQFWTADLADAHGNRTHTEAYRFAAGSTIAFVADHSGMPSERLEREYAGRPDVQMLPTAEGLHLGGQLYWALHDHLDEQAALSVQGAALRLPSLGAFALPLQVRYFFGVPRTASTAGRVSDVKAVRAALSVQDPVNESRVGVQIGAAGSLAEAAAWNLLSGDDVGVLGASTATLIAQALDAGQRLFQIDAANYQAALGQLQLSDDAEAEIAQAAQNGFVVVVHEKEISRNGWRGSGYVIFHPRRVHHCNVWKAVTPARSSGDASRARSRCTCSAR